MKSLSQRVKAELLLVLVTAVWGSTFVVVKGALGDASPLAFLSVRFVLASLLLILALRPGPFDRRVVPVGFVLGLFLFGGYFFQTWGLTYTSPTKSAFITGFSVILVPVVLWVSGQRLRLASAGGPLLGLAGLYLLVLPHGRDAVNRGDVFTLLASASFAVHIVLVGKFAQQYSFAHLVPLQVLVVASLAVLASPFDPGRNFHWTLRLGLALAVTSVLATGFAFSAQNWAQQFTPPAHTALIFALEPVFAALVSRVVTGERLGSRVLGGSALILAGMVISELWGGTTPSPVEG